MQQIKRKNKKRKVNYTRVVLVIIALGLVGATGYFGFNLLFEKMGFSLPEALQSEMKDSKEVHRLTDELGIAIYYPTFENEVLTTKFEGHADEILLDLMKEEVTPVEETQYLKVEYEKYDYQSKYVGVSYSFKYKDKSYDYSYFYDNNGNTFDSGVTDDFLKLQISLDARAWAKQDDKLRDLAHSYDFATKTMVDSLNDFDISVKGENLVVHFDDYYQGNPLTFEMDIKEIANHLDLDLGIKQTIAVDGLRVPKRYVDPNKPMVAITFDDGPYKPNTNQLIDTFYEYDGVATYYVVGNRLYGEEETMIRNITYGNEIGSHSYSHPDLTSLDATKLDYQLKETSRIVDEEITKGAYKIGTYRTPYGSKNDRVSKASPYPFIMWNIDTLDWKHRDPNQTVNIAMSNLHDGAVILLHDIHDPSIKGAKELIKLIKDKGYQMVSVQELFEAKGVSMENGVNYFNAY